MNPERYSSVSVLAIAPVLTLGVSLTHPNVFGVAWTLLVLASLGFGLMHRVATDKPYAAWKIWLLAFGPLTALSVFSAIFFGLSLSRAEVIELFVGGLAFCFGLRYFRLSIENVLWGLVLAALLGLGVGIYELFVLGHARVGMVFHPINFALGCGTSLLALILLSPWVVNHPGQAIAVNVGVIAVSLALLGTGSRGPILAALLCLAAAWWMGRKENITSHRLSNSKIGITLMAVFLALTVMIFVIRFGVDLRLGTESSIGKRWQLIELSLAQMLHTPWLGIGTDQAGQFFSNFPAPISSLDHTHVTLLNLGLELGIPGLLSWLWAFLVLGWAFSRKETALDPIITRAGLILSGYVFLCALTQDLLSHAYTRKYLALMLGLLLVMQFNAGERTKGEPTHA